MKVGDRFKVIKLDEERDYDFPDLKVGETGTVIVCVPPDSLDDDVYTVKFDTCNPPENAWNRRAKDLYDMYEFQLEVIEESPC